MQIKRIQWDFDAWEEYCEWQQTNKAVLKLNIYQKINSKKEALRQCHLDKQYIQTQRRLEA